MKKTQIRAAVSSVILGILSPLAMTVSASAATVTWNAASDNAFNTGGNWDGATAPVNGDTVVFPASANYQLPNNDIASLSLAKIIFNGDNSGTSSKSYAITGNSLTLTGGIDAVMTGSGGDHSVATFVTLASAQTFKTTGSNTLSVGASGTVLHIEGNDLTLDASGGTITLLGSLSSSSVVTGNLIKSGSGKVKILAEPENGHTGAGFFGGLTISAGETQVDSALGLPVTLTGGTLKGTGTIGTLTMSLGTVAPGASPGVLNTGNLTYTGGIYAVELAGTAAGQFDQTNVTGTVDLGTNTDLSIALFGGYAPAINDSFVIVNNDGTDAIVGNFKGLNDGDKVYGTYTYQINYNAGDGNDVVLLVTGNPGAPDTGIGTLVTNPLVTLFAAIAVIAVVGGIRFMEIRKSRKLIK